MPKRFMMILHDSTTAIAGLSPKEIGEIIARYNAWRDRIAQAGQLVSGEKLADEGGKHLTQVNGKVSVRDGSYAETKEIVGGFFLIAAADYDEAVMISRDCPHLALGGRIELREVEEV